MGVAQELFQNEENILFLDKDMDYVGYAFPELIDIEELRQLGGGGMHL